MPRDELDRYYTEPWLTRALIEGLDDVGQAIPAGTILEPCAGGNGIVDVLREGGDRRVITGDIDPTAVAKHGHDYRWDFLAEVERHGKNLCAPEAIAGVVSNPFYKIKIGASTTITAADFVKAALLVSPFVAVLLRVTWQEPCIEREGLLSLRPPKMMIICPRASFETPGVDRGGNKDMTCSAWYIWGLLFYETIVRWKFQRDAKRLAAFQRDLFDTSAKGPGPDEVADHAKIAVLNQLNLLGE